MKKILLFVFSLVACFSVSFFGSQVTMPAIGNWYQTINKPFFNPPNWIFAPVWTLLFFLMAVSLYLILINPKKSKKAIILFASQLVFNFLWSFSFFYLENPLLAFIVIIILIALVFLTYKEFSKINKVAGQLLLPYLAWISFASTLNLAILLLN